MPKLAEDYNRDGYVIVPQLFSPEEVEEIRQVFAKIQAEGVPGHYEPRKMELYHSAPEKDYPRMMHPHRYNERARHYMLHPLMRPILEVCMGGEPIATQSMYFFKPPGGRGQAMHQDNFFLMVEPGTCIGAWTAIDDVDQENGCVMVVPGSHRLDLICHEPKAETTRESDTAMRVPMPKDIERPVPAIMKSGDTLFFHGNVIHGSAPNRSKTRFRRSFVCHYALGDLSKISNYYLPLVRMDGSEFTVPEANGGGPCGAWAGSAHY
ncbi:hypothetical protein AXK11_04740 [Cephaloticoccus primus]|uniref:Phytanoyl-CoA dioxygenase n=1 Tax=Cephaloticoccus primus TaxID=1548207 RepID=A0A139SNE9_9BACT|nr:hypothetical protein AXK11_04740 [Cephaloticoccus primus]